MPNDGSITYLRMLKLAAICNQQSNLKLSYRCIIMCSRKIYTYLSETLLNPLYLNLFSRLADYCKILWQIIANIPVRFMKYKWQECESIVSQMCKGLKAKHIFLIQHSRRTYIAKLIRSNKLGNFLLVLFLTRMSLQNFAPHAPRSIALFHKQSIKGALSGALRSRWKNRNSALAEKYKISFTKMNKKAFRRENSNKRNSIFPPYLSTLDELSYTRVSNSFYIYTGVKSKWA